MDARELLSGLDDAQRAAVTSPAGPLCVHAGAGSGKTRVLTRRIAHRALAGDLDPSHTVALTFTRKAAGELRARLGALGLQGSVAAGTFHSVAYAQLRRHWEDRRQAPFELLTDKSGLVGELLGPRRRLASAVIAEIDWAAARRILPGDYLERATRARRRVPLPGDELPELLRTYETEKRRRRVVDFDDLLALTVTLMQTDQRAREARHWSVRHLFVDEFQDVNKLQFDLVRAWLGDRGDLFVVGDPHQAIYGWNGADARYIDRFDEAFPPQRYPDVEVLHLRDNHRSTPQVLAVAAAVADTARMVPHRPDGPVPTVSEHPDGDAEADAVARALRDGHQGGRPWSAQAVLVRTGAQVAALGALLDRHGIPNHRRGAGQLLRRPTVATILRRLRREPYGVVVGDLTPEPPAEGETPTYDPERDPADLEAVAVLAREYEALTPTPDGPGFADWLVTALWSDDRSNTDAVVVSTFHAAKGLEWPAVHLAGLEDGYVPSAFAATPEAVDEERRLLYVAVTRAQTELHLHWARFRTIGDRDRDREPSPWLADIAVAIERLAGAEQPVDGRRHLARPHEALRARRREADPVLERLRDWREQAARAARIPAEAVLDDQTLRAIAEARPDDPDALAEVPGLGPVKAARFGDALLTAVRSPAG